MLQAYTPGLKASLRVRHSCRRVLPLPGELLVQPGDKVAATDVIARSVLPGSVTPLNIARALSVPPGELRRCLVKPLGDAVRAGDLLAVSPGIFGWFRTECRATQPGTLESVSDITGQAILRGPPQAIELCAYLAGAVVEIIPQQGAVIAGDVTIVQGIFGVGGEAYGPVRLACQSPCDDLLPERITPDLSGAIVVGGARVTAPALAQAVKLGVAAIVTGGIDDADLRDFLGYDLGVATTGSEQAGLTLILTEGFGDIAMAEHTFRLLAARAGCFAAVNGATQIRAGVQRPELIVPWTNENEVCDKENSFPADNAGQSVSGSLRAGAAVRLIRDPYFGIIGRVLALPSEPAALDSGSKARVVEVQTESGERLVVPRANVELLEE
ncbi:MAG: hypothetical protein ACT4QC_05620 [Planctomycetaceae bacterium]